MFTFSLLQNYLNKQTNKQTNLSHNPKFNHTVNIYALCANSYLEGLSVTRLTAGPQPHLLRHWSILGFCSGLAGPTAHMWVHKFEPSLTAFLMALDSGATVAPQDGHHVVGHNTLLPHPSPMLPWGGLKVLKGNLLLLCFVHFCVPGGASHRPGPNEEFLCNDLVVQKQRGQAPNWRMPWGLWVLPGMGLESLRCSERGRKPIFDCWKIRHMPYTIKGDGRK